jgi:predicted RNA-binding protein with PUA-like domain
MPYLLKSEPDVYSYDDLLRDGETNWDGIKSYQALNYLAAMKKGEKLVIYHSNVGKEVVGTATIDRQEEPHRPRQGRQTPQRAAPARCPARSAGVQRLDHVHPVPALRRAADRRAV